VEGQSDVGGITRREFLKLAGIAVAYVGQPSDIHACIGADAINYFAERLVKPTVANPEILYSEGSVYVRIDVERSSLQDMLNNPDRYQSPVAGMGRLIHKRLVDALGATEAGTATHILELDKLGTVARIYDGGGAKLKVSMLAMRGSCRTIYSVR